MFMIHYRNPKNNQIQTKKVPKNLKFKIIGIQSVQRGTYEYNEFNIKIRF